MHIELSDDLPSVARLLQGVRRRAAGGLLPLMKGIGAVLENSTRQRFRDKTDPQANAWAALSPKTVKAKKSRKILVHHGDLMKSITYHASDVGVELGTDRHYGRYHQLGTPHMPARPFLGLSNKDREEINNVVAAFLNGGRNG